MASLSLRWKDIEGIIRFNNALDVLGGETTGRVLVRAVNRTGDMARTETRRALVGQAGLKSRYLTGVLRKGTDRATTGRIIYSITVKGGDVPLKYFGARETFKGVSAAPFGKRQIFPGTFMLGGRFAGGGARLPFDGSGRKELGMGGHVFEPTGSGWSRPFEKVKSGVVLPVELVQGASATAWKRVTATVLPRRVAHELRRMTGGVLS